MGTVDERETPRTEAGRRHVDWLVAADIPYFKGEAYRRTFTNSALAIEREAVAAREADLAAAVEGLPTPKYAQMVNGPDGFRAAVLRLIRGEAGTE